MHIWDEIINELKSKKKNNVNSKASDGKVPEQNNVSVINVYFLGSCHYASKHPNAGESFNNNKHVYFKNTNKEDGNFEAGFTFSGPTALDIKKPTIKSMTKLGIETLKSFIDEKVKADKTLKIKVNIKGHSRGAIIAKNVYEKLKQKFSNEKKKNIEFGTLALYDPYAGPLNGYKKSYDNIAIKNVAIVYSLTEGLYASPSQVENARIVIFTDCEHDKTKYIGRIIPNLGKGIYWFKGTQEALREHTIQLKDPNNTEQDIEKIYQDIDKYVKENTELITKENCTTVLNRFNDIKSSRRKLIFYKTIAQIDDGCRDKVKEYLEGKKQNRLLKSLGF